jgi:outer membrane protein
MNIYRLTYRSLTLASVVFLISFQQISYAKSESFSKESGSWLVGIKALNLNPSVKSTISIGGAASVDDDTIPELDVRYFLTDKLSIETILGTTKHEVAATGTALGDVNLGTVKVLPPTLTLQYHVNGKGKFSPYLGAGINYTIFYNADPGATVNVDYDDGFGFAFNVGFDYFLSEKNYLNVDIKKYVLSTDVTVDAGAAGIATADVDLDPIAISIGYGWLF